MGWSYSLQWRSRRTNSCHFSNKNIDGKQSAVQLFTDVNRGLVDEKKQMVMDMLYADLTLVFYCNNSLPLLRFNSNFKEYSVSILGILGIPPLPIVI